MGEESVSAVCEKCVWRASRECQQREWTKKNLMETILVKGTSDKIEKNEAHDECE